MNKTKNLSELPMKVGDIIMINGSKYIAISTETKGAIDVEEYTGSRKIDFDIPKIPIKWAL